MTLTVSPLNHAGAADAIKAAALASTDAAARTTLPPELGLQELLGWLATQLDQSDHAIRAQMSSLAGAKDESAAMASVKSQLDLALTQSGDPKHLEGVALPDAIAGSDWYKNLAAGPTKDAVDRFLGAHDGVTTATGDEIKCLGEALSDGINASASRNEMDMIKLQSAISARGQMIQMISNMVSAFEETNKNIVGAMRV